MLEKFTKLTSSITFLFITSPINSLSHKHNWPFRLEHLYADSWNRPMKIRYHDTPLDGLDAESRLGGPERKSRFNFNNGPIFRHGSGSMFKMNPEKHKPSTKLHIDIPSFVDPPICVYLEEDVIIEIPDKKSSRRRRARRVRRRLQGNSRKSRETQTIRTFVKRVCLDTTFSGAGSVSKSHFDAMGRLKKFQATERSSSRETYIGSNENECVYKVTEEGDVFGPGQKVPKSSIVRYCINSKISKDKIIPSYEQTNHPKFHEIVQKKD